MTHWRRCGKQQLLAFTCFLLTIAFLYGSSEKKTAERVPLSVSSLPRIEVPFGLMPQMERENPIYHLIEQLLRLGCDAVHAAGGRSGRS